MLKKLILNIHQLFCIPNHHLGIYRYKLRQKSPHNFENHNDKMKFTLAVLALAAATMASPVPQDQDYAIRAAPKQSITRDEDYAIRRDDDYAIRRDDDDAIRRDDEDYSIRRDDEDYSIRSESSA